MAVATSAAPPLPTPPAGPIPSLDGIRAVAVGLVFVAHAGLDQIVPGGLGVTIFFVLSGFLITTLMRQEHATRGAMDLPAFYLRRLLRLMPPLALAVLILGGLSAAGVIGGGFSATGLMAALFYFGNYHEILTDSHGMPEGLTVVWSLAVEEHFYLLFPPVAAWLLRRRSRRLTATLLGGACVALLAWRWLLALHGVSADYIYKATDTRVDAILTGCLMALLANPWLEPAALPPRQHARLAAACGLLLLASLVCRDDLFRMTLRYTLQNIACAGLLYLAVSQATHRPWRWLQSAPLVYLGSVSYTIYLFHHAILLALHRHWPQAHGLVLGMVAVALTLAVAEPMRRWVDRPCSALRQRLHRRHTTPTL
jgi:peptidoglycan/LPS O-acetylase OafA/YrhL